MGEIVRQAASGAEPNITEMPGLPEIFADGVTVKPHGETMEIIFTVARRDGLEAVVRVWMPAGAYEAARERYTGARAPRH